MKTNLQVLKQRHSLKIMYMRTTFDGFQRRNWTPQAMLYLKGTQGRRFISEDRNEGDVYDTVHLETRSQKAEQLSVSRAAAVLLNFLQQAKEEGESLSPPVRRDAT
uniref:Spexin hormone n=1 Tax=Paramormyrops kingsleyae TaxID=1676925 RepID=A0A3B3S390_9TELE